jgi:hypothetical protein
MPRKRFRHGWNYQNCAVMPAKAGIHNRRPVFMDTGFRRYDTQGRLVIPVMAILRQST